jgi:hypothetical protein
MVVQNDKFTIVAQIPEEITDALVRNAQVRNNLLNLNRPRRNTENQDAAGLLRRTIGHLRTKRETPARSGCRFLRH